MEGSNGHYHRLETQKTYTWSASDFFRGERHILEEIGHCGVEKNGKLVHYTPKRFSPFSWKITTLSTTGPETPMDRMYFCATQAKQTYTSG